MGKMSQVRRRKLLLTAGVLLAAPLAAIAQQQPKVWRIGFLYHRSRAASLDVLDAFLQGMRELGYFEGKNLLIEWRFADGKYDRLPGMAAELVIMKVDLIVAANAAGVKAVQQLTTTIPIVMVAVADAVAAGLIKNLSRPGGNTTGMSNLASEIGVKHLELLRAIVAKLSRVGSLANADNPEHRIWDTSIRTSAQRNRIEVVSLSARTAQEIESAFAAAIRARVEAVLVQPDGFFIQQREQLAVLAIRHRVPSIFSFRQHVAAGGLMSYGPILTEIYRHTATYVDKILKGAKPGELPVEQPTKFALVLNLNTFKALGLVVSQELLLRADEVIE